MEITAHGQARLQQRAIPSEAVDALLAYGERRRRKGADIYFLDKNGVVKASKDGIKTNAADFLRKIRPFKR